MARRNLKIQFPQTNSKTVVMSGGINEGITNLELPPGNLFACLNYEEIDGNYHGYSSVEGIERFDGQTSPSDVAIDFLPDYGLVNNTELLVESKAYNDVNDYSDNAFPLDFGTSVYDTTRSKHGEGSWRVTPGTTAIMVDQSVDPIDFNATEWTIDGWFQYKDGTVVILDKPGCIRVEALSGVVTVYISTDVSGVDAYSIPFAGVATDRWAEFKVVRDGDLLYLGVNGIMLTPISLGGENIISGTEDISLGDPLVSTNDLYLDAIRVTANKLAVSSPYTYEDSLSYSDGAYTVVNVDDLAREWQRSQILEVPGTGPVRGVHLFEGTAVAIRDKDGVSGGIYKETAAGWEEVTENLAYYEFDTGYITEADVGDTFTSGATTGTIEEIVVETGNPSAGSAEGYIVLTSTTLLSALDVVTTDTSGKTASLTSGANEVGVGFGQRADFTNERFAYWPHDNPNTDHFFFTSGTRGVFASNIADLHYIQGPDDVTIAPKLVQSFSNRLWLVYADGHVFYSAPGDPSNFSAEFGAGEIWFGAEITNLVVMPGATMAVIMEERITVLEQVASATAPTDYLYSTQDFTKRAGGYAFTADKIMGDVYFADDRGVTSMKAVDAKGDFEVGQIQKRAQITFQANKADTVGAYVHREKNQYRIFFSDGTVTKAIMYTFSEENLKGVTLAVYPPSFSCFSEGEGSQGNVKILAGSESGFVYLMDRGTSFDGEEIPTKLSTAFYHYRTPRLWKRFYRTLFEISASGDTVFNVKPEFNYRSSIMASARENSPEITGSGGIWGLSQWGKFVWSGSAVNTVMVYLNGYGYNMSMSIATSDKYREPHTVHNMITDYANGNMQM